jgi:predicted DCC family thiol-disulfide oxidoreductase YuxK
MNSSNILLFDADCILCNKTVQYILKHDTRKIFHFASLQSPFGQQFLKKNNLSSNVFSTVIYIQNQKVHIKSSAAIRVFARLNKLFKLLLLCLIIPVPIRDFIYDLVAKNRKRLFKNQTSCLIPSDELKTRIIE